MLTTTFTELLGLGYPVMSAPMSNHSGGELAAAVSAAGGLGTFRRHQRLRPRLAAAADCARALSYRAAFRRGVHHTPDRRGTRPTSRSRWRRRCRSSSSRFSDPGALDWDAPETRARSPSAQVQSAELAELAIRAGADVLLAQGNEAGGHTGQVNLLPLLVSLVERYPDVPVLAAGGITSGRALAGVLAAERARGRRSARRWWPRARRWRCPTRSRSA